MTPEMTKHGLPLNLEPPGHRCRFSAEVMRKVKAEVVRIGNNGTRQGFKFAEKMFRAYPELRGA